MAPFTRRSPGSDGGYGAPRAKGRGPGGGRPAARRGPVARAVLAPSRVAGPARGAGFAAGSAAAWSGCGRCHSPELGLATLGLPSRAGVVVSGQHRDRPRLALLSARESSDKGREAFGELVSF